MSSNRVYEKDKIATYARILFDSDMQECGEQAVIQARNEIRFLREAVLSNVKLTRALKDESYTDEQRQELVYELLSGYHPAVVATMSTMTLRKQSTDVHGVRDAYENLILEELGLVVVDVRTVVELDEELRKQIKDKASKDLGVRCELNEIIDPDILGGIIMSTRDIRLDSSFTTLLDRTRTTLKSTDGGEC